MKPLRGSAAGPVFTFESSMFPDISKQYENIVIITTNCLTYSPSHYHLIPDMFN